MKTTVFFNGQYMDALAAKISVFSPAVLYGRGVFETMRSYRHTIVGFKEHMRRLRVSCNRVNIRMPYTDRALKNAIRNVVVRNDIDDAYLKIVLLCSANAVDTLIFARPYTALPESAYLRGYSLGVAPYRHDEHSFLAGVKSTNRIVYELAYQQAKDAGFDEAIMLTIRGYLAEGTRSNVFFVAQERLCTPSLACGCLDGITRGVVIAIARKHGIEVCEGTFTLGDMSGASEVFVTNSLVGIMPVRAVQDTLYRGVVKKMTLTRVLMREYRKMVHACNTRK